MRRASLEFYLALTMILALALASWAFPVTVVDDRGAAIAIPGIPQRIVAIGALYAQIVVDLGAHDRLVGIADSPENPPETAGAASVGPVFSPSVEIVLSLSPDLVLGASDWNGDREALESVGVTVLSTPLLTSVADLFETIRTLGTALGALDAAERLIGSVAEEIVRIEANTLGADRPRAVFLYPSTTVDPPYTAGSGSIENELLSRAGAINVFSDVDGFPQVSLESIIARDPEVIFTAESQVDTVLAMTSIASVSAVRNGRVIGVRAVDATSTRVAELLRTMAEALHGP
jgi:iron complex transport system substrate-binding protein